MCDDRLQLGLVDLVGQKLRFIGNEVVEAGSHARNGRAVVIDHRKAKADGQQKAREVVEVEGMLAASCGESGFTPYQTTRMVANKRKRFCPIASKKPRFCVSRLLIA